MITSQTLGGFQETRIIDWTSQSEWMADMRGVGDAYHLSHITGLISDRCAAV